MLLEQAIFRLDVDLPGTAWATVGHYRRQGFRSGAPLDPPTLREWLPPVEGWRVEITDKGFYQAWEGPHLSRVVQQAIDEFKAWYATTPAGQRASEEPARDVPEAAKPARLIAPGTADLRAERQENRDVG